MYRVNKNNNKKRCTGTSDNNHCAPSTVIRCFAWCTVIFITCPSAPLAVAIFVGPVHLYCYSIIDAVTFLLGIFVGLDSFPHIKLAYLALFRLFKLYSRYPHVLSFWSLMCLCFLVRWIHYPCWSSNLIDYIFNIFRRVLHKRILVSTCSVVSVSFLYSLILFFLHFCLFFLIHNSFFLF